MKSRLGELLLAHGWITRADLAKALETQRLLGGRLGTCLLDQGALAEELLGVGLAEQHGVEAAGAEELLRVPEEVTSLLPRKLAVRWRAVPFRAHGNRLDVAMADPGDLACQDELSFAASRRVQVFVAPEVRIAQALARIHGETAPERLSALADRLDRGRRSAQATPAAGERPRAGAAGGSTPGADGPRNAAGRAAVRRATDADELFAAPPPLGGAPAVPPAAASGGAGNPPGTAPRRSAVPPREAAPFPSGVAAPQPSASQRPVGSSPVPGPPPPAAPPPAAAAVPTGAGGRPPRPTMVTLSDEERAALFGAAQAGVVASAALEEPAEVGFDQAVERLEGAADRDEVGQLLLAFFGHHFDRVVLLGVRREATTGWLATGEGLDRRRLETLSIPFDRPSIFLNLRQGSAFHLGPLPPLPAHRPLVALLGGDQPRECLLLPVRLGGRLVAALYADRGGDRLAGLDLESLRRLTELAGAALERAILLKRREKSGSAGG